MGYGRKSRYRNIIYLTAGLLIALIIGPLLGRLYMKDDSSGQAPFQETMDQKSFMALSNVHHEAMQDGRLDWVLDAASAEFADKGKKGRFYRLDVTLYDEDKTETKVSAKVGDVDFISNDFTLTQLVKVTNKSYILTSDKIIYTSEEKVIRSPGRVQMSGPSLEITADALRYDLDEKQAVFKGNVKAVLGGS